MSLVHDPRTIYQRLFVAQTRPAHVVIAFRATNGRNAIILPQEFVLRQPTASVAVRREWDGYYRAARPHRRPGNMEFINTSSANEWFLPSTNVGRRHAVIYWDGDDGAVKIVPATDEEGTPFRTTVGATVLRKGRPHVLTPGCQLRFGAGDPDCPFSAWVVDSIGFGEAVEVRPACLSGWSYWAFVAFFSLVAVCGAVVFIIVVIAHLPVDGLTTD